MESKTIKTLAYIFVGMVGFGIGLIAVSMFISVVDVTSRIPVPGSTGTYNASLNLFDADWDSMDASPTFLIISFLVLLAGLVMMAIDASVRQKLKKRIKGLNYVALVISIAGLILLIVSAIITKDAVEDSMTKIFLATVKDQAELEGTYVTEQQLLLVLRMMVSFEMGMGSIMAIIGGVIALIGSVMLVIPMFNPINIPATSAAQQPAANQAVAPQQPAAAETAASTDTVTPQQPTGLASVQPFAVEDENDVK